MGDWPARLLHIPTMTSCTWKSGNVYVKYKEPRYATISYTWGRWRLSSGMGSCIPTLAVSGIAWKIPVVDKALFSSTVFEYALRAIAAEVEVDFVWVDIACIDQNEGSAEGAKEIGRQAKIFRNSYQTYIWLVSDTKDAIPDSIEALLQNLGRVSALLAPVYHQLLAEHSDPNNRKRTRKKLADYHAAGESASILVANASYFVSSLGMPWFSSLWTLQEAFLQPSARFLDVDGHCAKSQDGAPIALQDMLWWCRFLYQLCVLQDSPRPMDDVEESDIFLKKAAIRIIERSGLEALAKRDRMALYAYAKARTTTRPVDRVYGIMQIWDFRLGVAAPGADPSWEWSPMELELQLGMKLLDEFPIESQLQVHASTCRGRQSWRISNRSVVPPHQLSMSESGHLSGTVDRRYLQLGHRCVNGTTYGHFRGKACSFEPFRRGWAAVNENRNINGKAFEETIARDPVWLALDCTAVLNSTTLQIPYPLHDIPPGKQFEVASLISGIFCQLDRNLSILLLGTVSPQSGPNEHKKATAIGLLVMDAPDSNMCRWWKRLGTCIWDCAPGIADAELEVRAALNLLRVESSDWYQDEGLFG